MEENCILDCLVHIRHCYKEFPLYVCSNAPPLFFKLRAARVEIDSREGRTLSRESKVGRKAGRGSGAYKRKVTQRHLMYFVTTICTWVEGLRAPVVLFLARKGFCFFYRSVRPFLFSNARLAANHVFKDREREREREGEENGTADSFLSVLRPRQLAQQPFTPFPSSLIVLAAKTNFCLLYRKNFAGVVSSRCRPNVSRP